MVTTIFFVFPTLPVNEGFEPAFGDKPIRIIFREFITDDIPWNFDGVGCTKPNFTNQLAWRKIGIGAAEKETRGDILVSFFCYEATYSGILHRCIMHENFCYID